MILYEKGRGDKMPLNVKCTNNGDSALVVLWLINKVLIEMSSWAHFLHYGVQIG